MIASINHEVLRRYLRYTSLNEVELEQKLLPPEEMYLALKQAISLGLLDAVVQGLF